MEKITSQGQKITAEAVSAENAAKCSEIFGIQTIPWDHWNEQRSERGKEDQHTECVSQVAIAKSDWRICGNAHQCLERFAEEAGTSALTPQMCKHEGRVYESCLATVATRLKSPHLCEQIPTTPTPKIRDDCFYELAKELESADLCEKIEDAERRGECFHTMARILNAPQLCNKVPCPRDRCYEKGNCFREMAQKLESPKLCNSISDNILKYSCFSRLAVKLGSPELCKEIQNEERKDKCLEQFEAFPA